MMDNDLKIRIVSFSYKNGIPADDNGNGGGFVFDCRLLPNPGRLPAYCEFTGQDQVVIDFLMKEPEVLEYVNNVKAMLSQVIDAYHGREFKSLLICFGCTGGQHRSVYIAETIAEWLALKFPVSVHIEHRELALKSMLQ